MLMFPVPSAALVPQQTRVSAVTRTPGSEKNVLSAGARTRC